MVATALAHAAVRPVAAVNQQRGFSARRASLVAPAGKTWSQRTVSNGVKTRAMMIWQTVDNKMFETMSFLPPLTSDQIAKQVDYIVQNNRVPCLEFADADGAYVKDVSAIRIRGTNMCNMVDNRYWTMWKLPMFGCTDAGQVLSEIDLATKAFPDAYIRLVAFDNVRQVQISSILVHRPASSTDYRLPENCSVQG